MSPSAAKAPALPGAAAPDEDSKPTMLESEIQRRILLAVGTHKGLVLWRNNVGVAEYFSEEQGRVAKVRYGLAPGSADLVGILNGRFLALEVKQPGRYPTPKQRMWAECARKAGGFVATVRSVEDAWAAIARCQKGERS